MPYEVGKFYWLQDRKTGDYSIGMCFDENGKFTLSEDEDADFADTEDFKPIGPAAKPLAYYIGEDRAQEWIRSKLEGSDGTTT